MVLPKHLGVPFTNDFYGDFLGSFGTSCETPLTRDVVFKTLLESNCDATGAVIKARREVAVN